MEIKVRMPGIIKLYTVKEGQQIKTGEQLAIMEALQIKHKLLSPLDGAVKKITTPANQRISAGTVIMIIE